VRTTLWAGCGLVLVGALQLCAQFGASVSFERGIELPVYGEVFGWIADVVLLAAAIVLAVGAPGEGGIVGDSGLAKVGLVLWGAGGLVPLLVPLLAGLVAGWLIIGLDALVLAGGAVAAVAIVRGGLRAWSRWSLLVLVAVEVLQLGQQIVLYTIPFPLAAYQVLDWQVLVVGLLQIAVGVGYLVAGRGAAIRARAASVRADW
jgi:hypothetical protein